MTGLIRVESSALETFAQNAFAEAKGIIDDAAATYSTVAFVQMGFDSIFDEAVGASKLHREAAGEMMTLAGQCGSGGVGLAGMSRIAGLDYTNTDVTGASTVDEVTRMLQPDPAGNGPAMHEANAVEARPVDVNRDGAADGYDLDQDGELDYAFPSDATGLDQDQEMLTVPGVENADPAGSSADDAGEADAQTGAVMPSLDFPCDHPGWQPVGIWQP